MGDGKKLTLFIVGGVIVALFLVWGGVLLGLNSGVRDTLSGLLPSGVVSGSGDFALQQEVLDKLESSFYEQVDPDALEEPAVDGMVGGLEDPYTVYMDPDEYAGFMELTTGSYQGVGMTVEMSDGMVTIVSTFKGSPAEEAGIKPGDVILEVDGVSTEGQSLDEVVGQIKGPEGTTVTLTIYHPPVSGASTTSTTVAESGEGSYDPNETAGSAAQLPPGGETADYELTRRTIEVPVSESELLTSGGKEVALISFYTFSDGSAAALRELVNTAVEQDGVDAIILDLRSNGGGLLNEAVDVTSIFVEEGVVVTTAGLHSPEQVYEVSGDAYADVPLYVLTDRFTASASEIVSGALQDHERATLIGETTFGKGLVQTIESLSNGGALKVTTAVYLTPDGRDINKTGIEPDVVAPDDPATPDVDEGVEAALALIAGTTTAAR